MTITPCLDVEKLEMLSFFEQFLIEEANLLDEQKFEEWSKLFVADGVYWVPAALDQPDPINHISLMYETDLLRAVRVNRYSHRHAFSLQPMPRSMHLLSNVAIENGTVESGEYDVRSKFLMLHYRNDIQDVYGGTYRHKLRVEEGHCKIVMKKVELLNCDAQLGNILLYF